MLWRKRGNIKRFHKGIAPLAFLANPAFWGGAAWQYLDAETTFSSIRIWAAMTYVMYLAYAETAGALLTIGNQGVEKVQYMVFLRGS